MYTTTHSKSCKSSTIFHKQENRKSYSVPFLNMQQTQPSDNLNDHVKMLSLRLRLQNTLQNRQRFKDLTGVFV